MLEGAPASSSSSWGSDGSSPELGPVDLGGAPSLRAAGVLLLTKLPQVMGPVLETPRWGWLCGGPSLPT